MRALVIEKRVIPINFLDKCNNDESSIGHYLVSTMDIRNVDRDVRLDSDLIISNITESILAINGESNSISPEVKSRFKQMLIECNESLSLNEYNSFNPNSNITTIEPNVSVRYISVTSL